MPGRSVPAQIVSTPGEAEAGRERKEQKQRPRGRKVRPLADRSPRTRRGQRTSCSCAPDDGQICHHHHHI
eukprot:9466955-Pyramimonas_sp.AAC.1